MNKFQPFKKLLASALDDEKNNRLDRIVDWTVITLIVISTLEIFLSTFPAISERISGILNFVDVFTTVIFTIEVTLRIWLA
jgi:hypothetical protein